MNDKQITFLDQKIELYQDFIEYLVNHPQRKANKYIDTLIFLNQDKLTQALQEKLELVTEDYEYQKKELKAVRSLRRSYAN